jgi:signal transduction histidine kinase
MEGGLEQLDEIRALALFRLVQESLTNVARHSQATRVEVRIVRRRQSETQETIEVSIADNGRGTDMDAPRTGLGLVGMRERVAAIGGSLKLASRRGEGFKVTASLPVATPPAAGRHA